MTKFQNPLNHWALSAGLALMLLPSGAAFAVDWGAGIGAPLQGEDGNLPAPQLGSHLEQRGTLQEGLGRDQPEGLVAAETLLILQDLAWAHGPLGNATLPPRLGGVQILPMPGDQPNARTSSGPHSLYYTFPDGASLSYYSEQGETSTSLSAYESAWDGLANLSSYGWLYRGSSQIGSMGFNETFLDDNDVLVQQGLTLYDDGFLREGAAQAILSEYSYSQSPTMTGYEVMEWRIRDDVSIRYEGQVDTLEDGEATVRSFQGTSSERTQEEQITCDTESLTEYSYVGGYFYSANDDEVCDSDRTALVDWHMIAETISIYDAATGESTYRSEGTVSCLDNRGDPLEYRFAYEESVGSVVFYDLESGEPVDMVCAYLPG